MPASSATVVIPTHKRPEMLRKLLESLCRQRGADFEVVVVNDGSGGDLSAVQAEFSDIAVKVIDLPESRGRAFARNEGVRNSRGELLIFVDDDMTVVEDFVVSHLAAASGPRTVVIGDVQSPPQYKSHPLARYIERQGVRKLRSRETIPPKCVRTGNLAVPRGIFHEIGMFDEAISRYGEDLDLGVRLAAGGADLVFEPRAVSFHHHPPDIDDMVSKMQEFGRYTVPHLVGRHPGLARVLRIDLAEPVRVFAESPVLSLKKTALRVILTPPFYRVARWTYDRQALGRLLFPVIDYIRAYNYIRGYWQARAGCRNS
jgi:glycosyltransferase involved in cell wall biosynthesis